MSKPSDLVQGTLDLLLLKILALEPLHGWAIGQRLKQVSGDVLQVSDGSLYPALHKLEQEGWITAEWKPTENNRRAKFLLALSLGKEAVAEGSRKLGAPLGRNHGRGAVGGGLRCVCNIGFTRYRCACGPFSGASSLSGISTKNCSITSIRRSRNRFPAGSIRPKRATWHCEQWMDSRSARRNAGTRGA